ncbi:hypothetical protein TWF718_000420 [Orbilia javanica]|uniref:Uncharacterized protein n=1 Tax=Orbilia javanica TaxID=47235 RepID=A0AAN8MZA8_9PEZI
MTCESSSSGNLSVDAQALESPTWPAYQPPRILLNQHNYLQWRALTIRKIRLLDWEEYLINERTKREQSQMTPEEKKNYADEWSKRQSCSTYILENVEPTQWTRFNPNEDDPYKMWKEIEHAWRLLMSASEWRYEMQLESLRLGAEESIDAYFTRAIDLRSQLTATGGEMDNSRFIRKILGGLPAQYEIPVHIVDYDLMRNPGVSVGTVHLYLMEQELKLRSASRSELPPCPAWRSSGTKSSFRFSRTSSGTTNSQGSRGSNRPSPGSTAGGRNTQNTTPAGQAAQPGNSNLQLPKYRCTNCRKPNHDTSQCYFLTGKYGKFRCSGRGRGRM